MISDSTGVETIKDAPQHIGNIKVILAHLSSFVIAALFEGLIYYFRTLVDRYPGSVTFYYGFVALLGN